MKTGAYRYLRFTTQETRNPDAECVQMACFRLFSGQAELHPGESGADGDAAGEEEEEEEEEEKEKDAADDDEEKISGAYLKVSNPGGQCPPREKAMNVLADSMKTKWLVRFEMR